MSLTDYGVLTRSPVRQPATDRSGMHICPECGKPVEGTRGTHVLNIPESADSEYADLPTQVRVFGFVCEFHVTTVVLPLETDAEASNLPDGWVGVRLRFGDELARYAPVLKKELPPSVGVDGGGSS